jgi:hypothetical protein
VRLAERKVLAMEADVETQGGTVCSDDLDSVMRIKALRPPRRYRREPSARVSAQLRNLLRRCGNVQQD